jgi:hypothetical protein
VCEDAVIEWLLEGDPAIRWQVMRDLLDAPPQEWEAERARTVETGWARFRIHRAAAATSACDGRSA